MFYLLNSKYFVMSLLTLFVLIGIVMLKKNQPHQNQSPQVLSVSTPQPEGSPFPSPSPSPENSPYLSKESQPPAPSSPSPSPALNTNNANQGINEFKYPGAKVISEDSGNLTLESPDQPGPITDWYKQKISSKNMNTTSFIVTSQNNSVSNKLVASNSNLQVKIDIERSENDPVAKVWVRVSNSD